MNSPPVSGATLVGLRPPGVPPRNRHTTSATGRASTIKRKVNHQVGLLVLDAERTMEENDTVRRLLQRVVCSVLLVR